MAGRPVGDVPATSDNRRSGRRGDQSPRPSADRTTTPPATITPWRQAPAPTNGSGYVPVDRRGGRPLRTTPSPRRPPLPSSPLTRSTTDLDASRSTSPQSVVSRSPSPRPMLESSSPLRTPERAASPITDVAEQTMGTVETVPVEDARIFEQVTEIKKVINALARSTIRPFKVVDITEVLDIVGRELQQIATTYTIGPLTARCFTLILRILVAANPQFISEAIYKDHISQACQMLIRHSQMMAYDEIMRLLPVQEFTQPSNPYLADFFYRITDANKLCEHVSPQERAGCKAWILSAYGSYLTLANQVRRVYIAN